MFASSTDDSGTVTYEGTCDENITWTLYDTGKLIIDGSGDMPDFSSYSAPWSSYRTMTSSIIIEEGITSIGEYAFYNFEELKEIVISNGMKTIGFSAFDGCEKLTTLEIPDSVTTIGMCAFFKCTALTRILYHGTKQEWNNISIGSDNQPLSGNVEFRDRINIAKSDFSYSKGSLVANIDLAWAKEDATAYFAVYDSNNKMVGLGLAVVKKGDTTAEVVIATDANYNGYQYKIMLWDPDTVLPYTKDSKGTLQY